MALLSDTLARVKPSPTVAMSSKAIEMRAAGRDIISLSAGEPDFDTPENIKSAAIAAILAGKTKYTAPDGIIELKQAICDKFLRDNALRYRPEQVSVGTGGKQVLYNALMATLNPGDEVIIFEPCYPFMLGAIAQAGAVPRVVTLESEQDFRIDEDALRAAAAASRGKAKMLVLNTPANPTGTVMQLPELQLCFETMCGSIHVFVYAVVYMVTHGI